jgi:hypothetical protein
MRIVLKIDKIAAGLLFAFLGTLSAYSQSTTSLRGVIADPSGAVIPGAAVAIRSVENGANRREMTNESGEYSFLQVAPGTYSLIVEKAGFAKMTKSEVKLLVNTPTTLDLKMAPRSSMSRRKLPR